VWSPRCRQRSRSTRPSSHRTDRRRPRAAPPRRPRPPLAPPAAPPLYPSPPPLSATALLRKRCRVARGWGCWVGVWTRHAQPAQTPPLARGVADVSVRAPACCPLLRRCVLRGTRRGDGVGGFVTPFAACQPLRPIRGDHAAASTVWAAPVQCKREHQPCERGVGWPPVDSVARWLWVGIPSSMALGSA
jgi:hypothetical protein